jgi:hypothetical protein
MGKKSRSVTRWNPNRLIVGGIPTNYCRELFKSISPSINEHLCKNTLIKYLGLSYIDWCLIPWISIIRQHDPKIYSEVYKMKAILTEHSVWRWCSKDFEEMSKNSKFSIEQPDLIEFIRENCRR